MFARPLRPWGSPTILSLSLVLLAGMFAPSARGQAPGALWVGGAGVWSNQSNWDCSGPPFMPGFTGPCVPNGAGYQVSMPSGSQVTLDISPTVNTINMAGATLDITGTSLTATTGITGGTLVLSSHGQYQGGFVGDSLSLDQGSQMNGGVGVNGPVTLSNGSQITGNVTGSSVTLSGGSSIDSASGFTGGSGTLSGGSQWTGLSGASGTFTMSGNSSVTGFGDFQGTLNMSGSSVITVTDNGANFGVAGMQLHGTNAIDGSSVFYETTSSRGVITVFGSLTLENGAFVGPGLSLEPPEVDVTGSGASLTLSGASTLVSSEAVVGTGSATITGGSTWIIAGPLTVGGLLQISGGSAVTDTSAVLDGGRSGVAQATVSGGGMWNTSGALVVGQLGPGFLSIQSGGVVSTTGNATLGDFSGSNGSVKVSDPGSKWNIGGFLTVGAADIGNLLVTNGGILNSGSAVIASQPGSIGLVQVGSGSQWNIQGNLTVADAGNGSGTVGASSFNGGELDVRNGGVVTTTGDATIANRSGSVGMVVLTGDGSQWSIVGNATIGAQAGSTGQLLVHGGLWKVAGSLTIGDAGLAGMGIGPIVPGGPGGLVTSGAATIANQTGSAGFVAVQHGLWDIHGNLIVGNAGNGSLPAILGGGTGAVLDINGGGLVGVTGNAIIAAQRGSVGTVVINGAGSELSIGGSLTLGGAGTALLTISNGGKLDPTDIEVGAFGKINGVGGTIQAPIINVLAGGTVAPGGPGAMNIIGNVNFQTGSILDLQIAGTRAGQFDQLNIAGNGAFHGTIDLAFIDGFTPMTGNMFDLINVSGIANFSGDTVDILGLPPGFDFTESFANGQFILTAENGGTMSAPEPGTLALLAAGIAAMLLLRRRAGKRIAPLR